ncbi:PREDICTED: anion exchange protein 2, partial [Corvus brachyrhynchos]|uniref:anion exchange protein 2 n=1 Tax=Corvus brachyrhynchos TaxID=85066 RepID=UPI0008164985
MTHSQVSSELHHIVSSAFQSGAGSPVFGEEEEEKDLNKALGVERFEEILNDAHPRNAEEAGRSYSEEDFECEQGQGLARSREWAGSRQGASWEWGKGRKWPSGHRFEDVPGVRRHLVRKRAKAQMVHVSKDHKEPSTRQRKQDRQPHEVFVELNELVADKNQELQWKETARWIKFEEDVEEETDRWGKPHVASLSFRSLLELRKTLAHGAVLLDLDQKTLPGVAHQVVEQMVITDQIRAEDRANVLRALLLKHSHPSDEKEFSFPRNISAGSLGSLLVHHHSTNHVAEGSEPAVTEHLIAGPT